MDEAHVQHTVRLVQHEDLNVGQVQQALPVEVQQAARRGHQNVKTPVDLVHLRLLAHAAEDDGGAQGQVAAVALDGVLDLDGQLPGGGEDQRPDDPGLALFAVEPLQNGGGEGAGLARARLGAAQHVPAGQGRGDGLCLDGGGGGVALPLQGGHDGVDETQFTKFHVV